MSPARSFSLPPTLSRVLLYPDTRYDDPGAHRQSTEGTREGRGARHREREERKSEGKGRVLRAYSRIRCDWALGRVRADLTPTKVPYS